MKQIILLDVQMQVLRWREVPSRKSLWKPSWLSGLVETCAVQQVLLPCSPAVGA